MKKLIYWDAVGAALQAVEAEQQTASEARDQYASSERRAMVLAGEIEELRTQLEAAERARKAAENELHEASDRVSDLSNANSSLATQKRKLENDIQAMQVSAILLILLIIDLIATDEDWLQALGKPGNIFNREVKVKNQVLACYMIRWF